MDMILHRPELSREGNICRVNFRRDDSWEFQFHKSLEVLYVKKGAIECTVNKKTDIIRPGEMSMCLPNEIHCGHSVGDTEFWVCVFSGDCVRSFINQTSGKEGEGFKFVCRDNVKKYVESVFEHINECDLLTQKSCLYAICGEYLRCVKLVDKKKNEPEVMALIVDHISQNYMNNICLSDIAKMLNYDYHYVSRLFHRLFKMSFNDYINVYRLEKAIELMEQGEKKLLDIAYESGFQSIRTFNSCFKSHYGTSPTEYRK